MMEKTITGPKAVGRTKVSIQNQLLVLILLLVISGCGTAQEAVPACNDDQIWNGQECVNTAVVTDPCADLPEVQKLFCEDIAQRRALILRQSEPSLREDVSDELSSRDVFAEILQTSDLAQIYTGEITNILCTVKEGIVTCADIISIIAAFNNETDYLILDDLIAMTLGDSEAVADILLNCGDGNTALVELGDAETESNDRGFDIVVGNDRASILGSGRGEIETKWWEEAFTEETDDQLVDLCARLSEGMSGGSAGLRLTPLGSEQCEVFSVGAEDPLADATDLMEKALIAGLESCSSILPIEGEPPDLEPPSPIERSDPGCLDSCIPTTENTEGSEGDGSDTTSLGSVPGETPAVISEGRTENNDGSYVTSWYEDGDTVYVDTYIQYDNGDVTQTTESYEIEPNDAGDFEIATEPYDIITETWIANAGPSEAKHILEKDHFTQYDMADGGSWTEWKSGAKTYLDPDGVLWYKGPGDSEFRRATPPGDCLDETCSQCRQFTDTVIPDAKSYLQENVYNPVCDGIRKPAECCVSGSDALTDPRILLPDPEGFACYGKVDPLDARGQFCEDYCSLAEQSDCTQECIEKPHPITDFDLLDSVCPYMISESCFISRISGTIPSGPVPAPAPFPYELNDKTLIPHEIFEDNASN